MVTKIMLELSRPSQSAPQQIHGRVAADVSARSASRTIDQAHGLI
jgi:hypothetical protein